MYTLHTLYTLIITVVFMFELCIVFDCTIIFSIDMPSVFAQSIVNDKKAGLAKRCKRDLLYGFYDNVRQYNPLK